MNCYVFITWTVVYCNTEVHVYNILVSAEDTNTTTTHLKINNNSVKTSVTATEIVSE